jgi:hypothetical protein
MNTAHSRHSDVPGLFGFGGGKRPDTGAAGTAGSSDPALATLGKVHRTEVSAG